MRLSVGLSSFLLGWRYRRKMENRHHRLLIKIEGDFAFGSLCFELGIGGLNLAS